MIARYIHLCVLFAAAVVFRGATPLYGQPSDSVRRIETVTVTALKSQTDVIPAQTLAGEELQRLSVVSVADAIRYFSGVQIKDYGGVGGLKTVNIRSMGTQHVGVFYDGVQLGNAQNGQIDLGRFSLDNMEAVSLHNGQKSTIFQSAKDFASAGSVYMTTRRPTFDEGKRNNLRLSLKAGSFETVNPSALWERRLGRRADASLNAEYMYTSGRYRFSYCKRAGYDTTETRRNGDVRALRVEGGLFGKIENGEWRTKLYLYDSERGYPGASVREEPGKFRHEDRQWDRSFFAQSSLRKTFGRAGLQLSAKYANDWLHYLSDPRLDVTTMYVDNSYRQQEGYFSAAGEFVASDLWRCSLSSDVQYNTLKADLTGFAFPSRLASLTAAATELDLKRFRVQGSLLYTFVRDHTEAPGASAGDRNEWTPTVAATLHPLRNADLNIRAFYKRIFRMPTLNDLYYTFIGNKNLALEYTTQYDLGAVYSKNFRTGALRRVELQADAYFNRVWDKIIAMPTSNQFQWTMLNLGYVEIRGIEFAAQGSWQAGSIALTSRLNYTYQKAQDFTDPADEWYGGQIPYIPWHGGSAILGATYGAWDANYSFIYTGERYSSRANIPENHAQPWYTHDMSVSRRIALRKTTLRLTAEVNNILNRQYEVVQCYPMPGTNFKIKITMTL
ncbi:MAG: TonB-dependent receptor [Rikenellaceae bacterium]|jgi:outer membrane cobalamin receptor|nr:TonB-dependent receptor [Rikenellaceae bacterium]